jgi:hypothetical protein
MPEQPPSGKDHGHAVLVRGIDHFCVSHGASGLNDRLHASFGGGIDPIAEWEERIGRENGPF